MSFLKGYCAASSKTGVLNVAGLCNATLTLLGCSACASLSPREQANSFLIADFHESGDLVAFILDTQKISTPYLVEIEKRDGIPYINLEKPESSETWVPKPDRMIQLFKNGYMRVKIDDEWFSTDQSDRTKGHRILPVSAGNLMVKYAYGLAEAKEIIDLAEEIQLQADAVEMLEIQAGKNALLNCQLREQENKISKLKDELESRRYLMSVGLGNIKQIEANVNAIDNNLGSFFVSHAEIKQNLSFIEGEIKKAKEALTTINK